MTLKLKKEIERQMAELRNAHVLFDTEDGPIYWDFNFQEGVFEAGTATNTGLLVEFSHSYEPSDTFQRNLEDFVSAAQDHFHIND